MPEQNSVSIFTTMKPGTLVEYRETLKDGVHFGKFRKFEGVYNKVLIDTIPPYGKQPTVVTLSQELVDRATTKRTPNTKFTAALTALEAKAEAEAKAALDLAAKKIAEKRAAKTQPVAAIFTAKPAAKVEVSNWRRAAAQKAWETIRANRAAALATA
jgi:hypothetical protein